MNFIGPIKPVITTMTLLPLLLFSNHAAADIKIFQNPVPFHFGLHPPGSGNQSIKQLVCIYDDASSSAPDYNVKVTTPDGGGAYEMDGVINSTKLPFEIKWQGSSGKAKRLDYNVDQTFSSALTFSDCDSGTTNAEIEVKVKGSDIDSASADLYQVTLIIELTEVP